MISNEFSEKILHAREEKSLKIKFLKSSFKTVITVKSNIPGDDKRSRVSYILVDYFVRKIPEAIIVQKWYYDTADGPCYLIGSNSDSHTVKDVTTTIEDSETLGRFIDIDVCDDENSLSRGIMRKCYICDKPAFVCIREGNHDLDELMKHVNNSVMNYFAKCAVRMADQSIIDELDLHPKFGLVTPHTSGSHTDMNYNLMISAKDAILPYIYDMFIIGFSSKSLYTIFNEIRNIGIEAEKKMFIATNEVNAYKGLIFNLGITVTAYAYCLYNHINLNDIFDVIKRMTKDILKDFDIQNQVSYGFEAYKKFNKLGARGEVFNGLPSVQKALKHLEDFSVNSRLRTLMYLISFSEDTVLLKRSGSIEKYRRVRRMFRDNLNSSSDKVEEINSFCLDNNLSFGGSADLLVLTIFLKRILR